MKVVSIVDHSHSEQTVLLDFDQRSRRRAVILTDRNEEILLDLKTPRVLRNGQGLALADGRQLRVVSKPEPLLAISCPDRETLVRIAWHLGNRHLPTQVVAVAGAPEELRIRRDHVIETMATGLGGTCRMIDAPFDPEGGAYASSEAHGHAH